MCWELWLEMIEKRRFPNMAFISYGDRLTCEAVLYHEHETMYILPCYHEQSN